MEKKRIGVIGLPPPEIELKLKEELGDDVEIVNLEDEIPEDFVPYKSRPKLMEKLQFDKDEMRYWEYGLTEAQRNAKIVPTRNSSVDPKINRNEPCPCGSLKKYKKCCGK